MSTSIERVCIGTVDRNPDPYYIRQVLRKWRLHRNRPVSKIKYNRVHQDRPYQYLIRI